MKTNRKRVVITGMGIISSLADSLEGFRQALLDRTCGVTDSVRFSQWFANARAAEVLHEIDDADIPQEIVESLDNAALWAYKVGKDALTQGGLLGDRQLLEQTGLIIGVSSAGTEAFLPLFEQRIEDFSLRKAAISGPFSSCCSSVATLLGLQGGVELVATACTASPNAMGMAFDYIQNGKGSTMLAIGTEPVYLPTFAGFYALNVIHPDACTPFSGQSGMSIGEGAGAVLLEDYDHAIARGATIYGELLSYATSCDAYHETGPDPRGSGAVQVMIKAMENAGVAPEQIDYINLHGTGTEANDRIETLAVKKVFPNALTLPASSTKSYLGHNIGAAGIVELIACMVILPDQQLLPTLNFGVPRPNCDLDYVPNDFRKKEVTLFMKNNYAFGGNNCCMVVSLKPGTTPLTTYQACRVAIVGMGAVSAVGHTLNEILDRIWAQDTDIALEQVTFPDEMLDDIQGLLDVLTRTGQLPAADDAATLPENTESFCTFQVQNLEPRRHLRRYDARKATRGGTFALIALNEALRQGGRKIKRDGEALGFIMGMSRGPQETTYNYLQSLKPDPTKVRTSEFPGSLMNAIATFCAISEGIKGYTTTLATGENAALGALTYGYEIVRQQLQPQVIVGGADEFFPSMSLYMDAMMQKIQMTGRAGDYQVYRKDATGFVPGEGACMLLLEDRDAALARNAEIQAEIIGYGKSSSTTYFEPARLDEKAAAMALAIERALSEANVRAQDIDLICGTAHGAHASASIEIEAIFRCFHPTNPQVAVVNYNAFFGFVESSAGLLNMAVIVDCIKKQAVPAIPYTGEFADERLNFVRRPQQMKIEHVLLLGATEGGNYYAFVIRGEPHG